MTTSRFRYALALLSIASFVVGGIPCQAYSQQTAVLGSITGKVFDNDGRTPLAGVEVRAHAITSDERLPGATTDERGSFFLTEAPPGIYAFTLVLDGAEYSVTERIDARAGMTFVLESCFRLDKDSGVASVIQESCSSELVAESQVVMIGPHRFLRPESEDDPDESILPEDAEPVVGPSIEHSEIDCLTRDQFPLVDSNIVPGDRVEVSRVYFRSDKYPDFYYVDMRLKDGNVDSFQGILPKPNQETDRIIYYLEAVDRDFNNSQTQEHDPEVTDEDRCRRDPAGVIPNDSAGIVVGATVAGSPAIPPGFQALGITGFISAAGTGGGTTGLVLVITGGAAAAGGVVVVTGGDDEASPP